jgi:hypothetical protein
MNAPAQTLVMTRTPATGDTPATAAALAAARDAGLTPQVIWQPLDHWLAAALGEGDEPLAAVTAWRDAARLVATSGATLTPSATGTDPVLAALGTLLATAARRVWPDLATLESSLGAPQSDTSIAPFAAPAHLAESAAAAWTDATTRATALDAEAALLRGEMARMLEDAGAAAARSEAVRKLRATLAEVRTAANKQRADIARAHAAALAEKDAEIARLTTRLAEAAAREQDLRASTSWRVTAPLRAASGLVRRGG